MWPEKFIGWLRCNSRISPSVHTLLPSVFLNSRYDLITDPLLIPSQVSFHVGEEKTDGAKSGEYGRWPTSSKPQSRTSAIATTELYAGALSFQSHELPIQCGFIWMETLQVVSGMVVYNACQVLLLWYNFPSSPSPTVPDKPTDDHRWGVSGSATAGPDTSLLSSV